MNFVVITKVPPDGDPGNLAVNTEVYLDTGRAGTSYDEPRKRIGEALGNPLLVLSLRSPVFQVGEVLLCDEDGRELVGAGRKPSKWSVQTATFYSAEEAVAFARKLWDEVNA